MITTTVLAQLSINPTVETLNIFHTGLTRVLGPETKTGLECKADSAGAVHFRLQIDSEKKPPTGQLNAVADLIHKIDPYCAITTE